MIQWLLKLILFVMGGIYVIIDDFVVYKKDEIAGIKIDKDLQDLSRKQLCTFLEKKYNLGEDEFWNLPSTSKIRLGCHLSLNSERRKP